MCKGMGEEEQGVIAGGILVSESLSVLPTATLLVLLLAKERAIDSRWVKQRLIILINRETAIRGGPRKEKIYFESKTSSDAETLCCILFVNFQYLYLFQYRSRGAFICVQ